MRRKMFESYWRLEYIYINIQGKMVTKVKASLKYSEIEDAFFQGRLEKKIKMLHVFEFFSNKSDSTLRNKNGAKLYTSLPPFSHLLFYSPRSFFIHFSLDIPHRILWRVLFFERILSESFSSSLNISKSNWKYSTLVASCFYIYLHFAIGFFRLWLSKPLFPFQKMRLEFIVCLRTPSTRRFAETFPPFPPPIFIFPPRIVSKLPDRRIRTFISPLSGKSELSPSPLCTWHGSNCPSICCNVLDQSLSPSLFPSNDPPSLPFNYNPLRNLSKSRRISF